jgi:hypothetical protein
VFSSNTALATVPASITVAAGARTASFVITTLPTQNNRNVTIAALLGTRSFNARLTVTAR